MLKQSSIASVAPEKQAAAAEVLEQNPEFDLASHQIDSLSDSDKVHSGVLKTLQRIQNISPDAASAHVLLDAGFTSATQVTSMEMDDFEKSVPNLDTNTAQQVYSNATEVVHRNQMFLASVAPSVAADAAPIRAAIKTTSVQMGAVNLDTLFHESVTTNCDDCNSVLSPAAYLVDLLEFLPAKAREAFLQRRPDVGDLDLSCANTNIEIPYIDLVNEVLESYVGSRNVKVLNNYQGDDSQQLIAEPPAPDNNAEDAYDWLAQQVFPIGTLPFDRNLEQTRVLLEGLGTSREAMFAALGAGDEATRRAHVAEVLGLTETEYVALAQESFEPGDMTKLKGVHDYWGFKSQVEMLNDWNGLTAIKNEFLPRTGLTYEGLSELLSTHFIRDHIPDVLLNAPGELSQLWNKVHWAEPKPDTDTDGRKARWGDLLASLNPPLDVESLEGLDVINVFPRLPNMATIFPTGRDWKAGNSERSVFCDVYFSEGPDPSESDWIGRMDHWGAIYATDSWKMIGWIDERNVWRAVTPEQPVNGPDIYTYTPFNKPENASKIFWLKNIKTKKPVVKIPRITNDQGTVATNQMTVINRNPEFMQTFGPAAGTDTVGWRLPPVAQDGEPEPELMSIRCLGGTPLSLDTWTRMNWFLRIMKRLEWSTSQTDRVLSTFESDIGSPALLDKLALLRTVQKLTGFSPDNALALIGDLSMALYKTLVGKASVTRTDPELAVASNGVPVFANKSEPRLVDHITGLAAAFGVSPGDIASTIAAIGRPADTNTLTLATISLIYRSILLCKATQQPLSQLSSLLSLSGADRNPFEKPHRTVQFIQFWINSLSKYKASPSEIEYFLLGTDAREQFKPPPSLGLQVALAIKSVEGEPNSAQHVVQIYSAMFPKIPTDVVALLMPGNTSEAATPTSTSSPSGDEAFKGFFAPLETGIYRFSGITSLEGMAITQAPSEAGKVSQTLVGGQFYVIEGSDMRMTCKTSTAEVEDSAIPRACLLPATSVDKVQDFLALLSRYNVLFKMVNIEAADLTYLLKICPLRSAAETLATSDLELLVTYDSVRAAFPDLSSMLKVLDRSFTSISEATSQLYTTLNWDEELLANLLSELNPDVALIGSSTSILETPSLTLDITTLEAISQRYKLCKPLGVSGTADVLGWATSKPISRAVARQIRGLVRSRIDDQTWADTAATMFDKIRLQSRDALIAGSLRLMSPQNAKDPDELFEHFLIDVNMGACLKTSRIKQAISSVQLFVQRCLLGIEASRSGITPKDFSGPKAKEWDWKKSIETWTANRKVFLYPENWLEPSLRDNKTDTFKSVEAALLEGKSSSTDLITKYVAGMLETADLQPLMMSEGNGYRRNHIIARTRMAPHHFYYRSYDKATDIWSPWEKLTVDIPTVQLMRTLRRPVPVALKPASNQKDTAAKYYATDLVEGRKDDTGAKNFMRSYPNQPCFSGSYAYPVALGDNDERLVIFVPTFTERSYKLDDTAGTTRQVYYWEVGMSFTEKREGQWLPRQISPETLTTRPDKYSTFPSLSTSGYVRSTMGIGVRDLDEHLMNQGSFLFFTKVDTDGSAVIQVFLGTIHDANRSFCLLWLGEYILKDSHCHLRKARDTLYSLNYPDSLAFDNSFFVQSTSLDTDWVFQARVYTSGDTMIRKLIWMPNVQPIANYQTPFTMEFLPKKATANDQLFGKRTMIFPSQRDVTMNPMGTQTLLSNNFAQAFKQLVSSGNFQGIFSYLDDDSGSADWPRVPNVPLRDDASKSPPIWPSIPDTKVNTTTVLHHSLGYINTSNPYFWYHEQRTPIALENWELCMHLPMLFASTYASMQQFDNALAAIKLVFDPTTTDKSRVWRFMPFRELSNKPQQTPGSIGDVDEWTANPFAPFVVARGRHIAYMKWFVYKYIEVMVSQGDIYFRRFTLESINLAIQCYVEAAHVFGPPPQSIASVGRRDTQTYNKVVNAAKAANVKGWDEDDLNNVLINMETQFPFRNEAAKPAPFGVAVVNIFGTATGKYFCVPANPTLKALRSRIDDRLFKIRHCQDIDGNLRSIALWEPPLDSAALVAAAARGISPGSVADSVRVPLSKVRPKRLIQFAVELCAEVKSLSLTILLLRKRKDKELLATLRLENRRAIGQRLRDVRQKEIEEAKANLEVLKGNRSAAVKIMKYYLDLLGEDDSIIPEEGGEWIGFLYPIGDVRKDSGFPLSQFETREVNAAIEANNYSITAEAFDTAAGYAASFPTIELDMMPAGVGESISIGGNELAAIPRVIASGIKIKSQSIQWNSDNASRLAGFQRQTNDRLFSVNQAGEDVTGIDQQITAQKILIEQKQMRLDMEELSLTHDEEMDAFFRSKYTNTELYTWSLNSLQSVYYTLYNLALDTAAQAEQALNFERGLNLADYRFITGGYWNSSHDGLFAGEKLGLALRRLQKEYMTGSGHDYELSRSISLRQIAPLSLANLRRDGDTGEFELPEALWDMDFPGHVNRRIKSVGVTVACLVGAHIPVNSTLTLNSSSFRAKDGSLMLGSSTPVSSAAISTAADDMGLFELNFCDEHYIPFEGAGVASKWNLVLSSVLPAFSYSTISDVILQIRYTANKGTSTTQAEDAARRVDQLLVAAAASSEDFGGGLCLYVDAKADFPGSWATFRSGEALHLNDLDQLLPYFAKGGTVKPQRVKLAVEYNATASGKTLTLIFGNSPTSTAPAMAFQLPTFSKGGKNQVLLSPKPAEGGASIAAIGIEWSRETEAGDWTLSILEGNSDSKATAAKAILSLQLLISYSFEAV